LYGIYFFLNGGDGGDLRASAMAPLALAEARAYAVPDITVAENLPLEALRKVLLSL